MPIKKEALKELLLIPKFKSAVNSNKISALYDKEARSFQAAYNKRHPGRHIWRHILYTRTLYFFRDREHISVCVEIVRFRFAGSSRTFTFYGSLFASFSRFSAEFIRQAVSERDSPCGMASSVVHPSTIRRWGMAPGFPVASVPLAAEPTT